MEKIAILLSCVVLSVNSVYAGEWGIYTQDGNNKRNFTPEVVEEYALDDYIVPQVGAITHWDDTNMKDLWLEVKNGSTEYTERFEVMAGMPSKENLHMSLGFRGMHTKVDLETYKINKFTNEDIWGANFLINIPWYETEEKCTVTISGLTGAASVLNGTWNKTNIDQAINNANIAMAQDAPTHTNSHSGYHGSHGEAPCSCVCDTTGALTGAYTITIPGCLYDSGADKTYPIVGTGWTMPGACGSEHGQPEGYGRVSIHMNHKMNGYIGETIGGGSIGSGWSGASTTNTTAVSRGGYATYANTLNGREEFLPVQNGNNWNTNGTGHPTDAAFNHFNVMSFLIRPHHLINTKGDMWTVKMRDLPEVALLDKVEITTNDIFNETFNNRVVAQNANLCSVLFQQDKYRIGDYGEAVNKFNPGVTDSTKWYSPFHYGEHSLINPAQEAYVDEWWVLPTEYNDMDESTYKVYEMSGMYVEKNGGVLKNTNFFIDKFYLKDNIKNQLKLTNKNTVFYKSILDIYNIADRMFKIQLEGTSVKHGFFISTDMLEVRDVVFNSGNYGVKPIRSGYILSNNGDNVFKESTFKFDISGVGATLNSGNLYAGFSGQIVHTSCETHVLQSDCGAENWTLNDAIKHLVNNGMDHLYYHFHGYNGNYNIQQTGNHEDEFGSSCNIRKMYGMAPYQVGNMCYFSNDGVLQDWSDPNNMAEASYNLYVHKIGDGHHSESPTAWSTVFGSVEASITKISNKLTLKDVRNANGIFSTVNNCKVSYKADRYFDDSRQHPSYTARSVLSYTSKYINPKWGSLVDTTYNYYANQIVVRNPSSVQFCKILRPPETMDQRVEDNTVYKGGDYNTGKYEVIKTDSKSNLQGYTDIRYIGDWNAVTDRRQYFNHTKSAYDSTIEERRKTVSFVNLGKEFELIFSDQFDITQDEFGNTLETQSYTDAAGYHDGVAYYRNGRLVYSDQIFGIPSPTDSFGYGWGYENFKNEGGRERQYTSCFPYSNKYGEGTHNYVWTRYVQAPFDMTVINKDGNYDTYKRGTFFDLNDLYQWRSNNENQEWNDISTITIQNVDPITHTRQIFKHQGSRHPYVTNPTEANIARDITIRDYFRDRLIYGICLLSNEERPNAEEVYMSYTIDKNRGDLDGISVGEGYPTLDDHNTYFIYNNCNPSTHAHLPIGSLSRKYSDIVGMIGNLTLNDTGDFRSSGFFKNSLGNGKFYGDGVAAQVDVNSTKNVLTPDYNILGDKNYSTVSGEGKNSDTWSTQLHKSKYNNTDTYSAILNPEEALKKEQLRPGYVHMYDVETVGNYDGINTEGGSNVKSDSLTNRTVVKPRYYLYNKDAGCWVSVVPWYKVNGNWVKGATNKFNVGDDNIGSQRYQVNDDVFERYNCTTQEQSITSTLYNLYESDNTYPNTITSWMQQDDRDVIGTTNMLILDCKNRNYTGSSKLRGVETVVVGHVTHDDSYERDLNSTNIGELNFGIHVQKYYFEVGVPTGTIFIPENATIDDEHNYDYWANRVKSVNGFIAETLQVQAYGPVWSLEMVPFDQTNSINVNGTNVVIPPGGPGGGGSTDIDDPTDDPIPGVVPIILEPSQTTSDDFNLDGLY